jgi:hypothetical protein
VDRCISYVGENAIECVKTNSFLNLPKDALVKLISSDCVCSQILLIIVNVYAWLHFGRDREGSGKDVKMFGNGDSSCLDCGVVRFGGSLCVPFS